MNTYTTGKFAKKANVSIRTLRYYDKLNLLTPTSVGDNHYRYYTDKDFVKLQSILTLKYLGFSLDDIKKILNHTSEDHMQSVLKLQYNLIDKKINNLLTMKQSLSTTIEMLEEDKQIHWDELHEMIHLMNLEKNVAEHYHNAENLDIRISLHQKYSVNKQGWFSWLYSLIDFKDKKDILELGCGSGELWLHSDDSIKDKNIILSDISDGMILDISERLKNPFTYEVIDCQSIPYKDESFDIVIANHTLFYANDISKSISEIYRVLKKGGIFYCSTYGSKHMLEINELAKEFDSRITLSDISLFQRFGLDNGESLLLEKFKHVEQKNYDDYLIVTQSEDILNYILSCHGNQNEILLDKLDEFRKYLSIKMDKKGHIKVTKEAGCFICEKL